jgi:hypothetical protein
VIKKLSVKNFKSIKELEIDCKRINLFIGEANTGKSNILETLGLLSWCGHYVYNGTPLKEYVRFQGMQNLFYDGLLEGPPIQITIGNTELLTEIRFENDGFCFYFEGHLEEPKRSSLRTQNRLDYSGNISPGHVYEPISEFSFIKFYRFEEKQDKFPQSSSSFLAPPHGANMFAVVMASNEFRKRVAGFFSNFGFKLMLRTSDRTFEIQKQIEDIGFSYPYISVSDTLQRMIFYTIAMESNENSTLIFEEPESHAFPDYTVYLGRNIASDEKNQYFIATHNPYFLLSILEKAPKDDVSVFVTYFEDYQTKVKCLNDEEMSELMVYDPFGNLDRLIGRLESFVEEEEQ